MAASYTRRRLGGRHPSCGIGVTSRIAVISSPTAWSERMAASRPAPGPRTKTSTCLSPYSIALRAATSAAVCAAKGVLLRAHREPAPVAYTSIAPDVHESLHVHRYLAAQVTLDLELALDDVADPAHLVLAPGLHPLVRVHVGSIQDSARRRAPDPVDVRDRDLAPLLPRQIHARNSRHRRSPFLSSEEASTAPFRAPASPAQPFLGGGPGRGAAPPSGLYPCLALCRGFLQITRVTPRRLMILQCSHRALIDGLTFIVALPPGHLNRYVIRPRVRSYGDSSTFTRSPGRIRMKFIRILPLTCASTR